MRLFLKLLSLFVGHMLCVTGVLKLTHVDLLLFCIAAFLAAWGVYSFVIRRARPAFPVVPLIFTSGALSATSLGAGLFWVGVYTFGL